MSKRKHTPAPPVWENRVKPVTEKVKLISDINLLTGKMETIIVDECITKRNSEKKNLHREIEKSMESYYLYFL